MKNTRNATHVVERLKDRRDYRSVLIQRREEIEGKIARTEKEIAALSKFRQQPAEKAEVNA